ncbi:MAG: 4-hydroxy-tetrahydrodipicolinate reductase [Clostridia bacterium]|nr:4-hydroxy-tetrahydrodipicolinate reductase [Clostridia bacterium]
MLKIIVSGCNGHMGQSIVNICAGKCEISVVAGFNRTPIKKNDFPVYSEPLEYSGPADVIIDFSNPANLEALLAYSVRRGIPIVLCTTGYSEEHISQINEASKKVPVFRSGNMSLGINLMIELVRRTSIVLGENFDVEIIERHHNRKVDAPSGTALMLADAASSVLPYDACYVYDRQCVRHRRERNEIGISSVRGGNIVGEHEVIFAGPDEVLELKHTAQSRDVFANGAVVAARFLAGVKEPGLYDINDALADILK